MSLPKPFGFSINAICQGRWAVDWCLLQEIVKRGAARHCRRIFGADLQETGLKAGNFREKRHAKGGAVVILNCSFDK